MLRLISPGTKVWIAKDIVGTVAQICIQSNNFTQYQIVWWDGRKRNAEWLNEHEVTPQSVNQPPHTQIGFTTEKEPTT